MTAHPYPPPDADGMQMSPASDFSAGPCHRLARADLAQLAQCLPAWLAARQGSAGSAPCLITFDDAQSLPRQESWWRVLQALPMFDSPGPAEDASTLAAAAALAQEFAVPVLVATAGPALGQPLMLADLPWAGLLPDGAAPATEAPALALARQVALSNHADASPHHHFSRGRGDRASRRYGFLVSGLARAVVARDWPQAPQLQLHASWPLPLKRVRGLIAISETLILAGPQAPRWAEELRAEGLLGPCALWPQGRPADADTPENPV